MTVRWETVQDIYIISKDLYIGKNKVENGNSSMVKPNRYCPNPGRKRQAMNLEISYGLVIRGEVRGIKARDSIGTNLSLIR